MIGALSRALVRFAADRWPARQRDEVRREWLAELAVLDEQHRPGKMLRYAVSLAFHPAPRPTAAAVPILPRLWYAVRVLLVGPLICQVLLVVSLFAMSMIIVPIGMRILPDSFPTWAENAQLSVLSLLCLGSAYLASRLGSRWAPHAPGFLLPVLIATVPGFFAAATLLSVGGADRSQQRHIGVIEIYFLGFGAVLYAAARLARAGRRKQAWWLGIAGAFVMLDIAVMPAVLTMQLTPEEGVLDPAYAPMWLPALLTDTGFGLPHPGPAEVFVMTDVLVGVPQILIIVTGWALGMVLQNRASSSSSALATASESPPSTLT
jgi:hypothetical protein